MIILYSTIYLISNGRRKYIIRGKFKNINYKKVAKYWFCFQMFSLLCMDWHDVISFPLIIIILCI